MKKQKIILITGASTGIGYDTAIQMRALGWRVFASARNERDVNILKNQGFESILLDVNDSQSIQSAFEHILAQTDQSLDAIFCNAGFGQVGAVEDISRDALREQFETNVFGTWECITHAMKIFRKQGSGRILVNSSILGFAAMSMRGAYNSSKFALEGMCDTMRQELRGTDIWVSLVEPGPVQSRFRANALVAFEKHIDWENSVHKENYLKQINRLKAEKGRAKFTVSAADCAKICTRAFTDARPKARYRVCVPTHVFWWLKKCLPTQILDELKRRAVEN